MRRDKIRKILLKFEGAFREARQFALALPFDLERRMTDRHGDFASEMDDFLFENVYRPVAEEYGMTILCEEQTGPITDGIPLSDIRDHDYLLLLDSVDGTVNMLAGLPFGVNIAFGRLKGKLDEFTIGDLDAVLVAEYQSGIVFHWMTGEKPCISLDTAGVNLSIPDTGNPPPLFEVPDERSYLREDFPEGGKRQERLLEVFRNVYSDCQRRAIDCTGLRMLEVMTGHLVAYGEARGAAMPWDTIPSIRMLLECDQLVVLDERFKQYDLQSRILIRKGDHLCLNDDFGSCVIVVLKRDIDAILEWKDYMTGGGRPA